MNASSYRGIVITSYLYLITKPKLSVLSMLEAFGLHLQIMPSLFCHRLERMVACQYKSKSVVSLTPSENVFFTRFPFPITLP